MLTLETDEKRNSLRAEHERLLDHVEHIRLTAVELPALSYEERRAVIGRVIAFLNGGLAPHAEAEERALYPHVASILGDPRATAPMRYDHVAIRRLTSRLAEASVHDTPLLQELLYGLHALITTHFQKEDELYLPLLERDSLGQVEHVIGAMREVRFEHDHPEKGDL
jgi:iron-sulfur cluster repair protein YtfE (RIC family)